MARPKLSTAISLTILMALGKFNSTQGGSFNLYIMYLVSQFTPGRAQDEEKTTLRHVGYFHDLKYEGDLYVSWAGGTILQFWGSGFNNHPVANQVEFRTWALTTSTEVTLPGTLMNGKYICHLRLA